MLIRVIRTNSANWNRSDCRLSRERLQSPAMNPMGDQVRGLWPFCCAANWKRILSATIAALLLCGLPLRAQELAIEEVRLPPLRIEGQPARAHTQGMEPVSGKFYVTARLEDARPKRALLLRTNPSDLDWESWDISPLDAKGEVTSLDHPGGIQSDGTRLWIPLAESKRAGRSIICAFPVADIVAGRRLKPAIEFPVNDHIGAVAVSKGLLFGANWDTVKVYVWDFKGGLQRMVQDDELKSRGLGVVGGNEGRAGVAVQDWKVVGDRLFAAGLFGPREPGTIPPASRLCWFERFLERDFRRWSVTLPPQHGTELAREAMAISGGSVYFLPADLGATNRLFRVSLAELTLQGATQRPTSTQEP